MVVIRRRGMRNGAPKYGESWSETSRRKEERDLGKPSVLGRCNLAMQATATGRVGKAGPRRGGHATDCTKNESTTNKLRAGVRSIRGGEEGKICKNKKDLGVAGTRWDTCCRDAYTLHGKLGEGRLRNS